MAPTSSSTKSPSSEKTNKAARKGTTTAKKSKRGGNSTNKNNNNGSVEDVEHRILGKMADRYAFGVTEVSKEEVLKFAGYSFPTARRFIDATKSLKEKNYVEYNTGTKCYSLTEAGLARAPSSSRSGRQRDEAPPLSKTNQAFREQLKEQFESPKAFRILEMLADGQVHDRLKVCNDLGYKYQTASPFAKSVSELKTYGFLEAAGTGKFKLTDKAFPSF